MLQLASSSSRPDVSDHFHRLYQYIMGVTSTSYEAITAEDVPDDSARTTMNSITFVNVLIAIYTCESCTSNSVAITNGFAS